MGFGGFTSGASALGPRPLFRAVLRPRAPSIAYIHSLACSTHELSSHSRTASGPRAPSCPTPAPTSPYATSFLMIYHEVFFLDCCGFAQPLGSIEWAIVYIKGRLCGYGVPESGVFAIS